MRYFTIALPLLLIFIYIGNRITTTSQKKDYHKSNIVKIIVKLPMKSSEDTSNTIREYTDHENISKILTYIEKQLLERTDWKTEKEHGGLLPYPFLTLEFYSEKGFAFNFGIGPDFFSTSTPEHKTKQVSKKEQSELLETISISTEKYEMLYRKRHELGAWKEKP